MTALRVFSLLLFAACSGATGPAGGACQTGCDCLRTDAPLGCAGEWTCGANKVCEFACTPSCGGGGVSTCAGDQRCNGTKCTARTTCP